MRRAFKEVLAVLDERITCSACAREVFGVPLFRTRGLDDLRSLVCPECGHTQKSYWLPKGKDVQAILNDAFLELELVTEWSLRLARTSVAIQLVDAQVEAMTVGDLKERLFTDVFDRNELGVERSQVALEQSGEPVDEEVPLYEIDERAFTVTFSEDAPVSVADAVEMLQHRIRTRFKPDAKGARRARSRRGRAGLEDTLDAYLANVEPTCVASGSVPASQEVGAPLGGGRLMVALKVRASARRGYRQVSRDQTTELQIHALLLVGLLVRPPRRAQRCQAAQSDPAG